MSTFWVKMMATAAMAVSYIGLVLVEHTGVYLVCYAIGRVSFPVFAYMLAEGFYNTKNVGLYLVRLLVLAVVSEIPFDLVMHGRIFYLAEQSAVWTLFLSLCGLYIMDRSLKMGRRLLGMSFVVFLAGFTHCLGAEYGAVGIFMVFILYKYCGDGVRLMVWFGVLVFVTSMEVLLSDATVWLRYGVDPIVAAQSILTPFCFIAVVPIFLHNRVKGYTSCVVQYAFYAFYPMHLIVLYFFNVYGYPEFPVE